ncbi:general substrate transporter [Dimargaris cristalligena]|uniref:General substrate transporter n=1 Tax=Dimargaris cristalligena TaxID=215637 RepID=A0A4P9ZTT5_9FUNG|nr:general substrate transporter [Dimargaris cristalligena]|eukprot:RKP36192.1 general substrate transporter [Dimargaris cristalligena]
MASIPTAASLPEPYSTESNPLLVPGGIDGRDSAHLATLPLTDHSETGEVLSDSSRLALTGYALFVGLVIALSSVQFGYHNGELNTPKEALTHCDLTDPARVGGGAGNYLPTLPPCLPMSDMTFSFVTSIFTLGGLVGSLLAPTLADRWGRKTATVGNNILYILGSLAMGLAVNVPWLLAGRFLVGVGCGVSIVVNPMYLTEIAPRPWRGSFGLLNQMGIVCGLLFTQTLGYFLNNVPGWRLVLSMGILLSVLQLFLIIFCVESPQYLAAQAGNDIKARASLCRLRGTMDVDRELATWQNVAQKARLLPGSLGDDRSPIATTFPTTATVAAPASSTLGLGTLFRSKLYRKPLLLALLMQSVQQWSGINTVFFYSTVILSAIFPGREGILTVLINVFNLIATIVSVSLVDRLGRRPLLLGSMVGMAGALLVLALSIQFPTPAVSLVGLFMVVGTFAVGLGPLSFLLSVELVDIRATATVSALGLAANWISNFTVSSLFLLLNKSMGGWVFILFSAILLGAGLVVYKFVPETRDKTTQEIWRDMGLIK